MCFLNPVFKLIQVNGITNNMNFKFSSINKIILIAFKNANIINFV